MKTQQSERQFWIQKQALDGGYVDHLGFPPNTLKVDAERVLKGQREFHHEDKLRLVIKTTTPLDL